MTLLKITVRPDDWLKVLEVLERNPMARWRFEGDNGYVLEGRLTAYPTGSPRAWDTEAKINVTDVRDGDDGLDQSDTPMCIGSVRAIRCLS